MSRANKPVWREWIESLLIIAALAVVIRSFVVAPFKIPSTSMVPTLEIGDYLFVLRYPYGFRIPFTDTQILSKQANRGDVAVFVYPEDKSKDYIKRVVGIPGDKITYRDNILFVNGKEMPLQQKGKRAYYMADGTADVSDVFVENLTGISHEVLLKHYSIKDGEWVVPEGHYFVLGDNRNNSRDSRFWGFVPQSYMVGRAAIIWWSWDGIKGSVRWDRLGHVIE
ncbi:signal peptidase I Serine peptidase, MEROPS family S26A [Mariprofundus ferrinatatus]|uniref:Signal peptidase I n=1 Tax=Mariprofundus ferrinatatus TaxID=1921087 RepID=A0A2K8LBE2_9PROT|nr:signal peptidase I [Mariprofundus ferrinatatus]ATX82244.1 signal peptidase I Serine peptidase, MEROPS family S26A [Mariprofundus ferrinatatus]